MAYIQPNSTIMILHNVPLEPDYEHTLYTAGANAQVSAFSGFVKYTLNANTYQRVNKNTCRVGIVADNLYDCNYMMFQNTNFGSKWFYAFITSVEYINNECTEITYEIDVMQSYFHNFTFGYCFVEREHSITDNIGDNLMPEPVECGDYYMESYSSIPELRELGIFVIDSTDVARGIILDETFQGGRVYCFKMSEETDLVAFLNQHTQTPENILAVWTAPCRYVNRTSDKAVSGYSASSLNKEFTALSGTETFGSYTPKNKKLYTYPFNFFHVDNGMGQSLQLKYEFFDSFKPRLECSQSIVQPVEVVARPYGYKGTSVGGGLSAPTPLNAESIKVSGYGVGSWNNNTWAQQLTNNVFNSLVGAGVEGFLAHNSTPVAVQKAKETRLTEGTIHSIIPSFLSRPFTPQIVYGSGNSGNALASHNELNFYTGRCRITEQYARSIDDFFTVFGYQTNRVKEPNISSRPHWNYVKTGNCEINADESMPADDAAKVKACMNKGITFWKSLSEVGRYFLNNAPT